MDHRFTSENQPSGAAKHRKKVDPLTGCLKAYLLDNTKAAKDGKPSARLGQYPPRVLDVVRALVLAASDPDSRAFGKAQETVWHRIAGKVAQEHEHTFPEVSQSITLNASTTTPPPMPSPSSN